MIKLAAALRLYPQVVVKTEGLAPEYWVDNPLLLKKSGGCKFRKMSACIHDHGEWFATHNMVDPEKLRFDG